MTRIVERKTRLVIESPETISGRAIVLQAEPWGFAVRLKGLRTPLPITWAQIYNRAAVIEAETKRAAKRARKREGKQ